MPGPLPETPSNPAGTVRRLPKPKRNPQMNRLPNRKPKLWPKPKRNRPLSRKLKPPQKLKRNPRMNPVWNTQHPLTVRISHSTILSR